MRRFAALSLMLLTLSACGEVSPGAATAGETDNAKLYAVTFESGLYCDVADGWEGGGAECDWASFTAPASWASKTGKMEEKSTGNSTTSVHRYEDGHLCVVVDGYRSATLDCFYPAR